MWSALIDKEGSYGMSKLCMVATNCRYFIWFLVLENQAVTAAEGALSTCTLAAAMGKERGVPFRGRSHCLYFSTLYLQTLIAKMFTSSILFCFLGTESPLFVR